MQLQQGASWQAALERCSWSAQLQGPVTLPPRPAAWQMASSALLRSGLRVRVAVVGGPRAWLPPRRHSRPPARPFAAPRAAGVCWPRIIWYIPPEGCSNPPEDGGQAVPVLLPLPGAGRTGHVYMCAGLRLANTSMPGAGRAQQTRSSVTAAAAAAAAAVQAAPLFSTVGHGDAAPGAAAVAAGPPWVGLLLCHTRREVFLHAPCCALRLVLPAACPTLEALFPSCGGHVRTSLPPWWVTASAPLPPQT